MAILAGDFLLARASALAASLGADVAGLLAATIGELCRGQVLELQHLFDVDRTEEQYSSSIDGKTAVAVRDVVPHRRAWSADCREPTLDALTEFGHHLGMCFQIVDDVLDLTATDEALGKPAGPRPRRGRLHAAGDRDPGRGGRRRAPVDPERAATSTRPPTTRRWRSSGPAA